MIRKEPFKTLYGTTQICAIQVCTEILNEGIYAQVLKVV
jgi:hypothetical protein